MAARELQSEEGFALVELLVAILVITIGVMALLGTFDATRTEATQSELHDTGNQVAQRELQRLASQRWAALALAGNPSRPLGVQTTDPRYYISQSSCGNAMTPPTNALSYCYEWDRNGSIEPIDIDTTNGAISANPTSWSTNVTISGTDTRFQGSTFDYVTWVKDAGCTVSSCGGTNGAADYKRITVAVTVQGLARPIWLSTVVQNQAGGASNPLTSAGTKCTDGGSQVPCTY